MEQDTKILLQDFARRVNMEPDPREFEPTPDGKANTLPISFVEMQLDESFLGMWGTRYFKWSAITNEVQGTLELYYVHPVTGKEISRVGAASIIITVDSIDKEEKEKMSKQARNLFALDPQNKKPNALDLGFPKLKAECLKNAAQSIGKLFGRDINRKKKDVFKPILKGLGDEGFKALIDRVDKGDRQALLLAREYFILDDTQKAILDGYDSPKQLSQ